MGAEHERAHTLPATVASAAAEAMSSMVSASTMWRHGLSAAGAIAGAIVGAMSSSATATGVAASSKATASSSAISSVPSAATSSSSPLAGTAAPASLPPAAGAGAGALAASLGAFAVSESDALPNEDTGPSWSGFLASARDAPEVLTHCSRQMMRSSASGVSLRASGTNEKLIHVFVPFSHLPFSPLQRPRPQATQAWPLSVNERSLLAQMPSTEGAIAATLEAARRSDMAASGSAMVSAWGYLQHEKGG